MNDPLVVTTALDLIGNPPNLTWEAVGVNGRLMKDFLAKYEGTDTTHLSSRGDAASEKCVLVFGQGLNDVFAVDTPANIVSYYAAIAAYYKALGWTVYEVTTSPLISSDYRSSWVINAVANYGGLESSWTTTRSAHQLSLYRSIYNVSGTADDCNADEIHLNNTGMIKFGKLLGCALAQDGIGYGLRNLYLKFSSGTLTQNQTDCTTVMNVIKSAFGYASLSVFTSYIGSGGVNVYLAIPSPQVITTWCESSTFRSNMSAPFASTSAFFTAIVSSVGV